MKEQNLYSNLNLIKIIIKLIESSDTGFKDIIDLVSISKVNYISQDNLEEITEYIEYVIEMLFDLLFKINETKRKYSNNYDLENFKKISLKNYVMSLLILNYVLNYLDLKMRIYKK